MDITSLYSYFPTEITAALRARSAEWPHMREIRLRAGAPPVLLTDTLEHLTAVPMTADSVQRTAQRMCQNSVYARQEELRHGFISLPGGHRAGFCGRTVTEDGHVRCLVEISSIHLRLAHAVMGAADAVLPSIRDGSSVYNTLIVSPPGCGKTTMLRELARTLSTPKTGLTIGIADERGEIAAMYRGMPQQDVGLYTDVYDGCPKAQAMQMLLRGMAPQVVITDELGSEAECRAVWELINSGVRVICSAHARGREEALARPMLGELLRTGAFQKIVTLYGRGQVASVL